MSHFDPKLGGGNGGRDYFTEVNSWLYTFHVQYDVAGLIHLMGGRDAFNAKLDRLFVEQYGTSKFSFLAQFPDATGLVGQYAQGNEPSFHIPYLYDFSGQPWKTQQRVRQLMDVWYGDGPLGIPGDDDGGATSSWYVLSAMGFYPSVRVLRYTRLAARSSSGQRFAWAMARSLRLWRIMFPRGINTFNRLN